MPAVGLESGNIYRESDIFDAKTFLKMKAEPLHLAEDEDSLVLPVRLKSKPHFRLLSKYPKRVRVGAGEDNETHRKVIKFILKKLKACKQFAATTYVFEENQKHVQTIYLSPNSQDDLTTYSWWEEARIPISSAKYIQPDICGRNNGSFLPGRTNPGIVIEVIQTHYPEPSTFEHLLSLSQQNNLVLFYFVRVNHWGSKYSHVDTSNNKILAIRSGHWLSDGRFYVNDDEIVNSRNTIAEWYKELCVDYFDKVMADKNVAPPEGD